MPILYSFRRCPYAMRARMALLGCEVELREVLLSDKPKALLEASPKGTVPVLVLPGGRVLDESRAICEWALKQADPRGWWQALDARDRARVATWFEANDGHFKTWLDRYKYADRYPAQSAAYYREQAEDFLKTLEQTLLETSWLLGERATLADVAVFPFVRQFAAVDKAWFAQAPYPHLRSWLCRWLDSPCFRRIMNRYPPWQAGEIGAVFPPAEAN